MNFFADLHIHSKWSIGTSPQSNVEGLSVAAAKKGIFLLGTGDFTHPSWLQELHEKLIPAEMGLFRLHPSIEATISGLLPPSCPPSLRFILQVELCTIFKKGERTRKIHHLVFVPDFASAQKLASSLAPFGALASDGRPTLLLNARSLLEIVLETHADAFLIPAHVWTPWCSILGSKTRFDSIEECYEDLSPAIFAVETGLSTDPPMNWRLSSLDRFQLVSNSDAHSPARIGRKACLFSCPLSFTSLRTALATGNGFEGTVELYPETGKYYLDGHRKCDFSCLPEKTNALNGRCPRCHKKLTIGVIHRLEELADRPVGGSRPAPKPFVYTLPLAEILSQLFKVGPTTKSVEKAKNHLLEKLGPELQILTQTSDKEIKSAGIPHLCRFLKRLRQGKIKKEPGYDGKYGTIHL